MTHPASTLHSFSGGVGTEGKAPGCTIRLIELRLSVCNWHFREFRQQRLNIYQKQVRTPFHTLASFVSPASGRDSPSISVIPSFFETVYPGLYIWKTALSSKADILISVVCFAFAVKKYKSRSPRITHPPIITEVLPRGKRISFFSPALQTPMRETANMLIMTAKRIFIYSFSLCIIIRPIRIKYGVLVFCPHKTRFNRASLTTDHSDREQNSYLSS